MPQLESRMADIKLDARLIEEATEQIEASSAFLKSLRESRALNVNPARLSEYILICSLILMHDEAKAPMRASRRV